MNISAFLFKVMLLAGIFTTAFAAKEYPNDNHYFDRIFLACGVLNSDTSKLNCLHNIDNHIKIEINKNLAAINERDRIHILNTKGIAVTALKENCFSNFSGWIAQQCVVNADLSLLNYLKNKDVNK